MAFICPRNSLVPGATTNRLAPGTKIVKRHDYAAWCDAQDMIAAARRQSDEILATAHTVYEEERKRGHAEGTQQAQLQQAEKIMETVGQTVDYLARFEHEIVELV